MSTFPTGGLNAPNTVIGANVVLHPTSNNTNTGVVPSVVNTTGGGDAIILTPSVNLAPSTQYTFSISNGVKDIHGDAFTPFSETFTTGNTAPAVDQTMAFLKQALPTTTGTSFTDLVIGPDGKLYASTEDGRIFRFVINGDGTLGVPQVFTSLQTYEGGLRLITGFAFDPSSTPSNPIIWVSNTFYALSGATNGPNFTSRLTVMSGPNLGTVQDAIVNLPRSVADHVNDQPVFQPGTRNLFFCQAGENAYGAPDTTWGNRSETMLSSAILEVDTTQLNPAAGPLNVLTPDVGGTYNPFAAGAPLTLYATGVRNAFSLYFDANGQLWAVANGSSSGGNTPAFNTSDPTQINGDRIDTGMPYAGPNVPALTDVAQAEADYLIRIEQGGYYGHPDPARGEYVLDDGNPTSGGVPGLTFSAYPSGTNPDPNYRVNDIYVLGTHLSPDTIFDYTAPTNGSNPFGGAADRQIPHHRIQRWVRHRCRHPRLEQQHHRRQSLDHGLQWSFESTGPCRESGERISLCLGAWHAKDHASQADECRADHRCQHDCACVQFGSRRQHQRRAKPQRLGYAHQQRRQPAPLRQRRNQYHRRWEFQLQPQHVFNRRKPADKPGCRTIGNHTGSLHGEYRRHPVGHFEYLQQ